MSEKYKAKEKGELYFITITTIDWVDLLTRSAYKEIIVSSLNYCIDYKGLNVYAYVIMTNHFHAIVSSDKVALNEIIRDLKKFTSKQLIKEISKINESRRVWLLKKFEYAAKRIKRGVNYKVWQDGFHPVLLSNNQMIDQRLNYIHNNPVKDEIVFSPECYVYSSASEYAGCEKSRVILKLLD